MVNDARWVLRCDGATEGAHILEALFEARGGEVGTDEDEAIVASLDAAAELPRADVLGAWPCEHDLPPVPSATRGASSSQTGWRVVFKAQRRSRRMNVRPPSQPVALLGADADGSEAGAASREEALANASANGVAGRVCVVSGLPCQFGHPAAGLPPSYDIVIAKTLERVPLQHAISLHAAPCHTVLAHIPGPKAVAVLDAWSGWTPVSRRSVRGWTTLHLRRP